MNGDTKYGNCKVCHASVERERAADGKSIPPQEQKLRKQAKVLGLSRDALVEIMERDCVICEKPRGTVRNSPRPTSAGLVPVCRGCNTALGFLGNDPAALRRALQVLT